MVDFPNILSRYKRIAAADHIWFAFIEPTDDVCKGLDIDSTAQVRIISYDDIPLFALFYKKELKTLDPYTVLTMLGEERITFPTEHDKECFAGVLEDKLVAYDKMSEKLSHVSRIAMIAGGVIAGAAATVIGTVAILKHLRKQ